MRSVNLGEASVSVPIYRINFVITASFLYARIGEGGLRCSRASWTHASMAVLCVVLGLMSLIVALEDGEASVVTPIAQLSFVVSTVMATLFTLL